MAIVELIWHASESIQLIDRLNQTIDRPQLVVIQPNETINGLIYSAHKPITATDELF